MRGTTFLFSYPTSGARRGWPWHRSSNPRSRQGPSGGGPGPSWIVGNTTHTVLLPPLFADRNPLQGFTRVPPPSLLLVVIGIARGAAAAFFGWRLAEREANGNRDGQATQGDHHFHEGDGTLHLFEFRLLPLRRHHRPDQ